MVFDLRQGDVYIFPTLEGGEISIVNGEPVLDQGFLSAVYLTLAGSQSKSWFGNEYLEEAARIESQFAKFAEGRELTSASILTGEELAKRDLAWIKKVKGADSVEVSMIAVSRNRVSVTVIILIDGESVALSPFQLNWGAQRDFPANERI